MHRRQYKVLSDIIGLAIFLLIMFILNNTHTGNMMAATIIGFLNDNLLFIIIMSLLMLIADIFYSFIIPFSLPAPIFAAAGSIFIITFIFRVFNLLDMIIGRDIFAHISWLRWIIYPIVVAGVLIGGYISIFFGMFDVKHSKEHKEKIINITPKKNKSWKDVGAEFRNVLHDGLVKIRKAINKKR